MWKRSLFIIIIIWLALALRLFLLEAQSLWYDEGVTWYLTQFNLPDLVRWTAADIQPPLYYALIWLTGRLMGESEWALRFPSAGFGVLSVPVIWQLGYKLFKRAGNAQRQWVSFLAAGFMATSPLMIYYSQEARMYTLLVLQASLAAYFVLRVTDGTANRRLIFGYILTMASALYTHYFAAFLLLAHTLYLLTVWLPKDLGSFDLRKNLVTADEKRAGYLRRNLKNRRSRLVKESLTMMLGAILLFAPWMTILVARLGDDPSYWPGVLKLDEIVQDIFISFAVGGKREMIFEADGLPLAAGFGVLLLVCLALLLWRGREIRRGALFLLLWLVLPVALILLLSYKTPKFNPRYTMLAWPSFALLLAGGLSSLMAGQWQPGETFRFSAGNPVYRTRLMEAVAPATHLSLLRHYLVPWLFVGSCLFIAFSWQFSLHNWFAKADFRRDDYRGLAQFIRERSFLNEPVLLNSGHFFPVWRYYFGPDGWTPLPKMETLDINRVVNFDIVPQLAAALHDQPGVWLVSWQDEVVDPNHVIPLLLDVVGRRTSDPLLKGDFIGLTLQYWHLPERGTFPRDFPATIPADFNFGNLVRLGGLWQSDEVETDTALFWEALQPLDEDYLISLRLFDADNVLWSDGYRVVRPGAYLYPTQRWPPGVVVAGRQALPWLPGTPPGDYWLEVGWLTPAGEGVDVLDAGGNPRQRTILLGPITLTESIGGLDMVASKAAGCDFGAVKLLEETFEPAEVETGGKALLETIWQVDAGSAGQRPAQTLTFTAWEDSQGRLFPLVKPILIDFEAIPAGTIFRSRDKLATPAQAAPGPLTLQATMTLADGTVETRPIAGLHLHPAERLFTLPAEMDIEVEANFAHMTTLLGATLDRSRLQPGRSATLTLYWQAGQPLEADYTVFVHPLGPGGTPVLNFDHTPSRPTSNWVEGEIVADTVTLAIPADFPAGRYPLEVGLYNSADPDLPRLPLIDGTDYIILTEIEVTNNEQ